MRASFGWPGTSTFCDSFAPSGTAGLGRPSHCDPIATAARMTRAAPAIQSTFALERFRGGGDDSDAPGKEETSDGVLFVAEVVSGDDSARDARAASPSAPRADLCSLARSTSPAGAPAGAASGSRSRSARTGNSGTWLRSNEGTVSSWMTGPAAPPDGDGLFPGSTVVSSIGRFGIRSTRGSSLNAASRLITPRRSGKRSSMFLARHPETMLWISASTLGSPSRIGRGSLWMTLYITVVTFSPSNGTRSAMSS